MLTWQHYVHNVWKNVINMSKNHRHYVHLCTEAMQCYSSHHRWWICWNQVPACIKNQYVTNAFPNTHWSHRCGVERKKNRCDVFREIMDTEYSNKNKLFCVGDTCTFVGMSVYGLWVVSTVRCCSKGPPNYPSLFLLPWFFHSFFLRTI